MCEVAVFINENGTSKKIASGIIRAEAIEGCISLLDSHGNVIKVDGTYIVTIDYTDNRISLKKIKKG
jgi:hypothetical protein